MFNIAEILTLNDLNKPYVIFLRHAEKAPLKKNEADYDRTITENGYLQSELFAKQLKAQGINLNQIKTSPVPRCVQTAEVIKSNLDQLDIIHSNLLGNPGAYIFDDQLAARAFSDNDVIAVINKLKHGEHFPGFRSLEEGSNILLNEVEADLRSSSNSIYLTHDVILASLLTQLLNLSFTYKNWIDYLQGFILIPDHTGNLKILLSHTNVTIERATLC